MGVNAIEVVILSKHSLMLIALKASSQNQPVKNRGKNRFDRKETRQTPAACWYVKPELSVAFVSRGP